MASAGTGQAGLGSARRRSLDADINLVPFIDLLSMCICFLLMTAVWTQVGSVPVKQSYGTSAAVPSVKQSEIEVSFVSPTHARLSVKKSGKATRKLDIKTQANEGFRPAFEAQLPGLLKGLGGSRDGAMVSSVMLKPHAGVNYGILVSVMDVFRRNEISNIGVMNSASRAARGSR